jgi:hypothetical protein
MQYTSNKVISRIYGHGKGWVFSQKDLADCGTAMAVNKSLLRLRQKGTIRLLFRGIYEYPRFSKLLGETASPAPQKIAYAVARKFGWSIYPTGETALNLLGLSNQVPAKHIYFSDGPSKKYTWNKSEMIFKKRAIKETSVLSAQTALVVQALKALGKENVGDDVITFLKTKLSAKGKSTALREARYVTSWVYDIIKKVAKPEVANG